MKNCTDCKVQKDETEFNKDRSRRDGLTIRCRECGKGRDRQWYATRDTNPTPQPAAASLVKPQPWAIHGACRGIDPELFHPERGASTKEARQVCAACPVRRQCLDYALDNNEKQGIWGGTSGRERLRIWEERRQQGQVAS